MNEPLLSEKLASREAGGGLSIMIPEGKRGMSVRVDDVVGVAGFVLPGSRVDVVVTMPESGQQTEAATRLVLQNIEVVSAGQSIERTPDGTPQQVAVVTLLVGPDEAEQLALAHSNGRLQLALRNPLDQDSTNTPGIRASQLIAGRAPPQPVVRATAPRPAAAPAAPAGPQRFELEVYRGPERSTSEVEQTLEGGAP
jgi:pilus assembly protein CpaB